MSDEKKYDRSSSFDHEFSGLSVWIEPNLDSTHLLLKTAHELAIKCGGSERGVHKFVPHLTLLYNINPNSLLIRDVGSLSKDDKSGGNCNSFDNSESEREDYQEKRLESVTSALLEKCLDKFKSEIMADQNDMNLGIQICPTSFYYFPYPKTADGGRGFGCLILLLLLKHCSQTPCPLNRIHSIIRNEFPNDERHGSEDAPNEGAFIPHMALVYAPETESWLEQSRIDMENDPMYEELLQPMRAKYLSVWSTQGNISEWKRISKVEL